nr:uncharacterized protein LOC109185694 [Ipomoea batatas]
MENPLFDSGLAQLKEVKSEKVPTERMNVAFTEAPIASESKAEEGIRGKQQQGVMKPAEERDFYVERREAAEITEQGMRPDYLANNPMNSMINDENHRTVKEGGKTVEGGVKNLRAEVGSMKPVCENVPMNANMNKNGISGVNRTQIAGEGKGKNVQGGRVVQGNQWGMGRMATSFFEGDSSRFKQQNLPGGNGVGATDVNKGKEHEGSGNAQQIPTNTSRNQVEGISIDEQTADKAIWKPVKSGKFSFAAAKKRKRIEKVILESDVKEFAEGMVLQLQNGGVICSECKSKVNCLAKALADRSEGNSVVYNAAGSLPRGFHLLLALEGIPHFSWSPGLDRA